MWVAIECILGITKQKADVTADWRRAETKRKRERASLARRKKLNKNRFAQNYWRAPRGAAKGRRPTLGVARLGQPEEFAQQQAQVERRALEPKRLGDIHQPAPTTSAARHRSRTHRRRSARTARCATGSSAALCVPAPGRGWPGRQLILHRLVHPAPDLLFALGNIRALTIASLGKSTACSTF